MTWRHHTAVGSDNTVHVWPDHEEHATEGRGLCWCDALAEEQENGAVLVLHKALNEGES